LYTGAIPAETAVWPHFQGIKKPGLADRVYI